MKQYIEYNEFILIYFNFNSRNLVHILNKTCKRFFSISILKWTGPQISILKTFNSSINSIFPTCCICYFRWIQKVKQFCQFLTEMKMPSALLLLFKKNRLWLIPDTSFHEWKIVIKAACFYYCWGLLVVDYIPSLISWIMISK